MAEKKETAKTKRPSALKRDMQSEKRHLQNRALKSRINNAVRDFEKEGSSDTKRALQSLLDKSAKKHVYKRNKVARLQSKLALKAK